MDDPLATATSTDRARKPTRPRVRAAQSATETTTLIQKLRGDDKVAPSPYEKR